MSRSTVIQSATSLPPSPEADRHRRMVQYTTAMSIRTVCFVLAIFVPGWGHLIFGIGAMVLPYIAVVLANAGNPGNYDRAQGVPSQALVRITPDEVTRTSQSER